MSALIWDSSSSAYKESEIPKVYSGGVWQDTDGKVWNGSAWVDAWSVLTYGIVSPIDNTDNTGLIYDNLEPGRPYYKAFKETLYTDGASNNNVTSSYLGFDSEALYGRKIKITAATCTLTGAKYDGLDFSVSIYLQLSNDKNNWTTFGSGRLTFSSQSGQSVTGSNLSPNTLYRYARVYWTATNLGQSSVWQVSIGKIMFYGYK